MGDAIARALTQGALFLVAALIALGGLGFLAAALFLALDQIVATPWAALATAAVLLAVAGLMALVANAAGRARKPAPSASTPLRGGLTGEALEIGRLLGSTTEEWTRTHRFHAILVALGLGFTLGVSPKLRKNLFDGLARFSEDGTTKNESRRH